ncbi:MAG TPA: hypothetical protein VKD28_12395 [Gemmatimonadales bacterium]|nr:hypothetical protein [Gemmatimonadales bacterium]
MQRIGLLFLGLFVSGIRPIQAQQATGTTLWRVAAATVPTPAALALGPAAALWNPAQRSDSARVIVAVEAIQTPAAVDATGIITTVRLPVRKIGELGLIYGRVGLSDISQTSDSPDPSGTSIPVYTFAVGGTWSRRVAGTDMGATVAFHETRLDTQRGDRVTFDVGASRAFSGDLLRIAAATHFFSSLSVDDPSQDIFGGVEVRVWQGQVSGERAVMRGRYGIAFAHGFTADHQLGIGFEFAKSFNFDFMVAHEGSYGSESGWRPVAGARIVIGKYNLTLARDGGVNDIGAAYRVGIDARFK